MKMQKGYYGYSCDSDTNKFQLITGIAENAFTALFSPVGGIPTAAAKLNFEDYK
jgi:hypothetical protein